MRTTIGQLVSELVDRYERIYHDHELATVAATVMLDAIMREVTTTDLVDDEPTQPVRRIH